MNHEDTIKDSVGLDVPLIRLRPLRERKVTKREYDRILASIKAVGLIEPLVIFPEGEDYVILDGVQRHRALTELGIDVVPCILGKQREAFTGNRMVNRVSPIQEHRMIEKSLGEVDEAAIAAALGISGLGHRLKKTLLKQLHPEVAAAFDAGKINRVCAREFTHVKPHRQREIIQAMESYKDYSTTFARTLVVKTPPHQRESRGRKHNPWDKSAQKKNDLLKKLAEAEQKHDFYSLLYKQYTVDLLRLAIYARSLLTNTRLRDYLGQHHADIVERFGRSSPTHEGNHAKTLDEGMHHPPAIGSRIQGVAAERWPSGDRQRPPQRGSADFRIMAECDSGRRHRATPDAERKKMVSGKDTGNDPAPGSPAAPAHRLADGAAPSQHCDRRSATFRVLEQGGAGRWG